MIRKLTLIMYLSHNTMISCNMFGMDLVLESVAYHRIGRMVFCVIDMIESVSVLWYPTLGGMYPHIVSNISMYLGRRGSFWFMLYGLSTSRLYVENW